MCLRCSPGLFRHARGVASCHTSSMAAKPHLGLTQNSSPTTLANERRAAQNRGFQGTASPVARRSGRNPLASQSAIRRWRNPHGEAVMPLSPPHHGVADGGLFVRSTAGHSILDALKPHPIRSLCIPGRATFSSFGVSYWSYKYILAFSGRYGMV